MSAKTLEFRRRLTEGESLSHIQAGMFCIFNLAVNFLLLLKLMVFKIDSLELNFGFIYLILLLFVMLLEAFAVVREAAKRKLGMRHFDVQVSL